MSPFFLLTPGGKLHEELDQEQESMDWCGSDRRDLRHRYDDRRFYSGRRDNPRIIHLEPLGGGHGRPFFTGEVSVFKYLCAVLLPSHTKDSRQ